ncbi:MAG: LacI family DNA-binding transcriptional regulator [Bifidobacterium scardovii]|uniref:LacI family DNA-binding transcriptional regulator n=1 Tax=Bifidobacterium scardovii TaxID=158787 RepID=UPI00137917EA|nr:LacI family DNA-binding transcriptional regulator [Bifidobacterium scardovii]MBS6947183.1 LacI family DNA-binding transcriptional regulator [Bifidobacterium scardovii]MDU3736986.1 LacI family DNA-binding transcriptional regulator [Bifidobacterium scardovii]MDU5296912.1 LacI family DNA-binding transcriptional regulator [Bifidobacterium scardovii]MDU5611385.1 LacI family DNA-binding transcriptional regulator [Bifidobacterium scardovii]MDU5887838.1 LacI family DNA-binding transcriptional regul
MATQKHVTMNDVAKLAGVSLKTVSNVVNDYEFIKDSTRRKVLDAIDELGYAVNVTAKNLRSGRSDIIGLCIPDPQAPYFAKLLSFVIQEAQERGKQVMFSPTGTSRRHELDLLHGPLASLAAGLIISPLFLSVEDEPSIDFAKPLVIFGDQLPLTTHDRVTTENMVGVYRATARLAEHGCRRIAIIGVHEGQTAGAAPRRLQGYRQALRDAGLEHDPALEIPAEVWYQPTGEMAVRSMIEQGLRPDGIVCMSDLLAAGALHELRRQGIRVPQDVKVFGYDDSVDSQYLYPALSSVDPNLRDAVRIAVDLLCDRIEGRVPALAAQAGHGGGETGETRGTDGNDRPKFAQVTVPSILRERAELHVKNECRAAGGAAARHCEGSRAGREGKRPARSKMRLTSCRSSRCLRRIASARRRTR